MNNVREKKTLSPWNWIIDTLDAILGREQKKSFILNFLSDSWLLRKHANYDRPAFERPTLLYKRFDVWSFSHFILSQYQRIKGQTTQAPNYSCNESDSVVTFSLYSSSHSARGPTSNCTLPQCRIVSSNSSSCRASSTPCFDYRTIDFSRYCGPAVLCSILEPCANITFACASNTSKCVINSCCSPRAVCLPLLLTNLCIPGNHTFYSTLWVFRNQLIREVFFPVINSAWFVFQSSSSSRFFSTICIEF